MVIFAFNFDVLLKIDKFLGVFCMICVCEIMVSLCYFLWFFFENWKSLIGNIVFYLFFM